jgi:light-independent protochlorophyllide reductase subunit N
VIKLDLSRAAHRLNQLHHPAVRVLNYSGSGIETTFTQGEDACLAALVPGLPSANPQVPSQSKPQLMVVGTLADVVEDQLRNLLEQMNITVNFFPPRNSQKMPVVGPNTRYLLAQPFLADGQSAARQRCQTFTRCLPFRHRGHYSMASSCSPGVWCLAFVV